MNKKILVVAIGLLLLGGSLAAYFMYNAFFSTTNKIDEAALKSGSNKQYEDLSKSELEARTQKNTGYTTSELESLEVDRLSLNSFEKASSTAQSLAAIGQSKKSVQAFEKADSFTSSKKNIDFYTKYREAADVAGEYEKGDEAIRKQISMYESMNDDPAAPQQITILKQRLQVRQQERNE